MSTIFADSRPRPPVDPEAISPASALDRIREARILFGHQSVGRDVLEGLRSAAQQSGRALRIVRIEEAPLDAGPGIFSALIGRNADPASKCDAFAELLLQPHRPPYGIAMMKFCYVDLSAGSALSPRALLERYERMVTILRRERPELRLVHITMPLRVRPNGARTQLKRLLGRRVAADEANALRCEFNEALRARYANEPIFDLARAEATLPDGARCSHALRGRCIDSLAGAYSHDGGHLNELGQAGAARALLAALLQA